METAVGKDVLFGKKMVILGLARQGKALARFAAQKGAIVVVSDLRPREKLQESISSLAGLNIDYVLGEHPMSLLEGLDYLAISGGVPADLPLVIAARKQKVIITNDSQEFALRTPGRLIGITGSAGKTTTTTLTGLMGETAGVKTWVGGNIGRPLIADLDQMTPGDLVVQELSSFQLEIWQHSPQVAAVLNITPNHLDRHESMASYKTAKANILKFQGTDGIAVLSADDPGAMSLAPFIKGRMRLFSIERPVKDGAYVQSEAVWLQQPGQKEAFICSLEEIQLRGRHNLLNVCAAITLADSVDIPVKAMRQAIKTFKGVEHRLELVATINGASYINDSIATAPERAIAAINSFNEPLILLAGGRDKNMVWDGWLHLVCNHVKQVILFGELGDMLAARLEEERAATNSGLRISQVDSLAEAVSVASTMAVAGDVILLAPGGTSFDAYVDFAERGQHFRNLVQELSGISSREVNGRI